jgi:carboxyl-terminal processing protease
MKRLAGWGMILLLGILLFSRCEKDVPKPSNNNGDTTSGISSQIKYINNWIWDVMSEVYYWNAYLPDNLNPNTEPDPEKYFEKLLYSGDNFSWITDDYEQLMNEYQGVSVSMGYSPAFGRFTNSNGVFIVVEYIIPGSPAERAGIKRGDIIVSINGIDLDMDNYYDMYSLPAYSVTYGELVEGGIAKTDSTVSMTAEQVVLDPIIYYEIFELQDTKIGYLVYVEFKSGESERFNDSLGVVFDEFAAAGISDLIIDLRYNPGGDLTSSAYLASAIAPASVVQGEEILVRFEYNDLYNEYFLKTQGSNSPYLVLRFPQNDHNINLSRVYFLTTGGTASASEFLMIGLYPYMDVIQVGEYTYGKYAGAWIIQDIADPPKHNWGLVPTVFKYANATGFTDFGGGLAPDFQVDDELIGAMPFGDLLDPVLNTALQAILADTRQLPQLKSAKSVLPFERIDDELTRRKRNLFAEPLMKGFTRHNK